MTGYLASLRAAAALAPAQLRGASLLILGDNQAAICCINNFRSSDPAITALLHQFFEACLNGGCDVQARWVPRDNIQEANALSRAPDATDWAVAPFLVRRILKEFNVSPAIDFFASGACHVTSQYVSRHYEPGCVAVQALRLDWTTILPPAGVAWAFPPTNLTGQTIARIIEFKVDTILILRSQKQSNEWQSVFCIPGARISSPFYIPKEAASCIASLRVPKGAVNPAFLGLAAIYIRWP